MKVEQNTISRDWFVLHNGRRFFVNLTKSDGQTLRLCNRDNWEIAEETVDGIEELNAYLLNDSSEEQRQRASENARLIENVIAFCIDNWDNEFMREVQDELPAQRADLNGGR